MKRRTPEISVPSIRTTCAFLSRYLGQKAAVRQTVRNNLLSDTARHSHNFGWLNKVQIYSY